MYGMEMKFYYRFYGLYPHSVAWRTKSQGCNQIKLWIKWTIGEEGGGGGGDVFNYLQTIENEFHLSILPHICRETDKNTRRRIQKSTHVNILWAVSRYSWAGFIWTYCTSYWSISLPSAASKVYVNSLFPMENTDRYIILLCSVINRRSEIVC